jgi:pectate lyase-like protein
MKSPTRPVDQASRHALLSGVFALLAFFQRGAHAADYYVAPTGSDANAGSLEAPFATLQKGADIAVAGDTVYIRGGTYNITTPKTSGAGLTFTKSGTSDANRIKYWAYQSETPIFDFTNMVLSTSGYTHGFVIKGSWLHFRGLELRNVPMNSFSNNAIAADTGGNCIFELLNLHHNSGNGIFIGKGPGGNLILNCDAHDNYDATSNQGDGQNADGFGVHYQTSGASTIIRGCRAWWNSDDGYDLINHEVPVIIENSWAMGNGYIKSGTARPADGNGNGFKAGSSKTGVRHVIRNSLAWKNVAAGFYANHSSGGNDWFNNTSYNNGTQYNMLASDPSDSSVTIILTGTLVHKMRNNIGFPNKNTNMVGVDTASNSWDLSLTPAAADFTSILDTDALGPRKPDGSLPDVDFMKLPKGSKMIDKGTTVGLPFVGAAPDLGAFEYGATSAVGASGAGTGGSDSSSPGAGVIGRAGNGATAGTGPSTTGGVTGAGASSANASGGSANGSGGSQVAAGAPASSGSPTAPGASGNPSDGSPQANSDASCGCSLPGRSSPDAPLASTLVVLLGAVVRLGQSRRRFGLRNEQASSSRRSSDRQAQADRSQSRPVAGEPPAV